MTGSQYVIKYLTTKGVRRIFGYPGANILPLYADLCESALVDLISCRHEQNAAFAASGYAKISGKPGVCIATSGPGATNLITGIADAYLDSAPLIIITGQVSRAFIGRDAFQEADIMGMTIPVTKHNYLVKDVRELPKILDEAYRVASTGRKGPVLIDITYDVFVAEIDEDSETDAEYSPEKKVYHKDIYDLETHVGAIRNVLASSSRPLILAGGGVASAHASFELGEFAKKSGIPVAVTLMGKGIVLPDGCKNLGMAGVFGTSQANRCLDECDLLIAVGVRFSDRTIRDYSHLSRSKTIIHCDIDPAEIDKNVKADIGIVSDAAVFISVLSSICGTSGGSFAWGGCAEKSGGCDICADFTADAVMREISAVVESSGITCGFVTDVGDNQMAAAQNLSPSVERGFVTSGGIGAMGFGLPAGIGAAFAVCDADVGDDIARISHMIIVCGDGGFQMSMQEMVNFRELDFPAVMVIIDNASLGMIEHLSRDGANYRFANPDFCAICDAYGVRSVAVSDIAEFSSAFRRAVTDGERIPCVIVARTVV